MEEEYFVNSSEINSLKRMMPSSPFTFGFPAAIIFFNEPRWSIAKAPMTWFLFESFTK